MTPMSTYGYTTCSFFLLLTGGQDGENRPIVSATNRHVAILGVVWVCYLILTYVP